MSTFLPYLFAIPTYLGAILEIIFYICGILAFVKYLQKRDD